jgi:hypothetical protein
MRRITTSTAGFLGPCGIHRRARQGAHAEKQRQQDSLFHDKIAYSLRDGYFVPTSARFAAASSFSFSLLTFG